MRAEGNTKLGPKKPEKPQEPAPILFPDLIWVWSAFCFLSERRGLGPNGPVPITVEAMNAYTSMTNRREREYLDQVLQFVPLLDREYLKQFYDSQAVEMEKTRKKTETPAQRGGLNRAPPMRRR